MLELDIWGGALPSSALPHSVLDLIPARFPLVSPGCCAVSDAKARYRLSAEGGGSTAAPIVYPGGLDEKSRRFISHLGLSAQRASSRSWVAGSLGHEPVRQAEFRHCLESCEPQSALTMSRNVESIVYFKVAHANPRPQGLLVVETKKTWLDGRVN